jgi:hypothetical protein
MHFSSNEKVKFRCLYFKVLVLPLTYSSYNFIFLLLLPERPAGKAWKRSNKRCPPPHKSVCNILPCSSLSVSVQLCTSWRHMGWCRYTSPLISFLGTMWWLVISFTLRPLYPRWKSPQHPWSRRLDETQGRPVGCLGEQMNGTVPQFFICPSRSLATIPAELSCVIWNWKGTSLEWPHRT